MTSSMWFILLLDSACAAALHHRPSSYNAPCTCPTENDLQKVRTKVRGFKNAWRNVVCKNGVGNDEYALRLCDKVRLQCIKECDCKCGSPFESGLKLGSGTDAASNSPADKNEASELVVVESKASELVADEKEASGSAVVKKKASESTAVENEVPESTEGSTNKEDKYGTAPSEDSTPEPTTTKKPADPSSSKGVIIAVIAIVAVLFLVACILGIVYCVKQSPPSERGNGEQRSKQQATIATDQARAVHRTNVTNQAVNPNDLTATNPSRNARRAPNHSRRMQRPNDLTASHSRDAARYNLPSVTTTPRAHRS